MSDAASHATDAVSDAGSRATDAVSGRAAGVGLAAICLLGFCVRALGFEDVFLPHGEVVLAVGDGHYHARAALWALTHFPHPLTWDPYLGFPAGSSLPAPPLPDLLAAAVAAAAGGGATTLERVLAWNSPFFGALTPVAVYLAARAVASRATALAAAALFALLPISAGVARVGDADHHALVNGLGAALLACVLHAVAPAARGARLRALAAALVLCRLLLLLSWSGAILYLALAEGALLLCAAWTRRRDLLAAESWSAAASALLVLPAVLALPPVGGAYSTVALSRFHVLFLLAAAATALSLLALERRRPAGPVRSLGRLAAVCAAWGAVALALVPGLLASLAPGLGFVSEAEQGTYLTTELMPLFPLPGRAPLQPASHFFGLYAYLLPLAPVAAALAARDPRRRLPALVLAGWTLVLGALTVFQVRFGADFAASGCVAFGLLLGGLARGLRAAGVPRAAAALATCLVLPALLWTPLRFGTLPAARASLEALGRPERPGDAALASPAGSLKRFLESVQRITPETSGYLDAAARPEYGVLNRMRIGHAIRYWARRPPTADGLLHLVAPEHFADARRFFEVRSEPEALAIARRLRARYVITMFFPGIPPGSLGARLQHGDGGAAARLQHGDGGAAARLQHGDGGAAARAALPLAHFRLVTEGPGGGRPLSDLFGLPRPDRVVPYKLFEIVPGALLEVAAAPGAAVTASLSLRTPLGRRLDYETRAAAGPDGRARLRVPYATSGDAPTRALGPWRVRAGDSERLVAVSEDDVRGGAALAVEPGSDGRGRDDAGGS